MQDTRDSFVVAGAAHHPHISLQITTAFYLHYIVCILMSFLDM